MGEGTSVPVGSVNPFIDIRALDSARISLALNLQYLLWYDLYSLVGYFNFPLKGWKSAAPYRRIEASIERLMRRRYTVVLFGHLLMVLFLPRLMGTKSFININIFAISVLD